MKPKVWTNRHRLGRVRPAALIYVAAPRSSAFCLPNTRFLLHQPSGRNARHGFRHRDPAREINQDERASEPDLLRRRPDSRSTRSPRTRNRDYWLGSEEAKAYGLRFAHRHLHRGNLERPPLIRLQTPSPASGAKGRRGVAQTPFPHARGKGPSSDQTPRKGHSCSALTKPCIGFSMTEADANKIAAIFSGHDANRAPARAFASFFLLRPYPRLPVR
ncbi:hypothetical protein F2981_00745 [Sinorhizobium meliloti]|nr:hypothetical protein [Sinorhizobium meliloti]